jgi:hypothetical protein
MVIIDLTAACVAAPRAREEPARPGPCVPACGAVPALAGASPELVTELDRADTQVTVLIAGSLPVPAA